MPEIYTRPPPVSLSFRGQLKRFIDIRATIFTGIWGYTSSAAIRYYCFPRLGGSPIWLLGGIWRRVTQIKFALFLSYPRCARSGGHSEHESDVVDSDPHV